MNDIYKQKVELLLRILPFVTDESCFAIHGGTAINLFVKNFKESNPKKLKAEANKLRSIFGMG